VIHRVLLSKRAVKDLDSVPTYVAVKLQAWKDGVEGLGLEEMRKRPGFHDEPLKGDRKGQRSIRLSRSYRAIYRVVKDQVVFVLVEEVNKHEY
jgi:toxin HigB-1